MASFHTDIRNTPELREQNQVDKILEVLSARYTIERPLGRGGMATVYLAREWHPQRQVAIKVLAPERAGRNGRREFQREIEILSQLTHPHIVPVFAAGEVDGLLYYVMPFYEGQSLRDRLVAKKRLPLLDALRIALDVAMALEHAHERGVVHRDVKPENILLVGGHALVGDFGIAHSLNVLCTNKRAGAVPPAGTPGYMSPEQATGSADIDPRTDIYSLARVLCEMLVGELPVTYYANDPLAGVRGNGRIPSAIEQALGKALAWDPRDRFQTIAEFAGALSVEERETNTFTLTTGRGSRSRSIPTASCNGSRAIAKWKIAAASWFAVASAILGLR